jgi:hypothetical protein
MFEQWPGELTREAPVEEDLGVVGFLVTNPDCGVDFRATIDRLLEAQPGPDVLATAAMLDPRACAQDCRLDLVKVYERCKSWVDAQEARQLAAAINVPEIEAQDDVIEELSLSMRWSGYQTSDRFAVAHELEHRLPQSWERLAAGRLSYDKAHDLAHETVRLGKRDIVTAVEAAVLPGSENQTRREFRNAVREAVIATDPEGAQERYENARKERRVIRYAEQDGQATLRATGPAQEVNAMWAALTQGADKLKATGQADNLDQGRFDTMVAALVDSHLRNFVPTRKGAPVGANITVAASTVAGDDDHPAQLEWYGPITAQVARDLLARTPPRPGPFSPHRDSEGWYEREHAADFDDPPPDPYDDEPPPGDAEWPDRPPGDPPNRPDPPPTGHNATDTPPPIRVRLLPVDPATGWLVPAPGEKLDNGDRRLAGPGLSAHVKARHLTCVFPTCSISAQRSQVDHFAEHAQGGRTDSDNTGPACEHHNCTVKNRPGWVIEPLGGGQAILRTPLGRTYPIEPYRYWLGERPPSA